MDSRERQDVTQSQRRILEVLAKYGPSYHYDLFKNKKIASNKTVLDGLHRLAHLGLTERKSKFPQERHKVWGRGRNQMYYGLTFHGVLYCLNIDIFKEDEAAKVRLRNFAHVPVAFEPESSSISLGQEALGFLPESSRIELERVRCLLETNMKEELERLNRSINRIASEAQNNKRHVQLFSFVEENQSEKIYGALRRVNPTPGHYDSEYARYIFQKEFAECFNKVFAEILAGKQAPFDEMNNVLSDPYSLEVLQKALFPYYATIHEKLQKLEYKSGMEWLNCWKQCEQWFANLSKASPNELKHMMKQGPKSIADLKRSMNKL